MKLTDSILLQEVLSGHTSVVLQDEPKIIRNALTKHKVLMISDGPVDMYMPIINSWFERIGILLDLKLCTSHNFIAAPELFLNDSAVKIVGPALKSSASIIINEFLKFADRDKKQKIFFLTNSGDFVEYDAIERGKEFPELDFPSIDIPDIYGSGVTLQSISNACHFLYSCFERLLSPKFCKLVFVDLDNTLYFGEVAEGNPSDLEFTPNHIALANWLIRLSSSGVFVETVSRNSERVLEDLRCYESFKKLEPFITRFNFTFGSKGEIIRDRISFYKFHPVSVSVIDDNPAELLEILQVNPELRSLRVLPNAANFSQIETHIYTNPVDTETNRNSLRLADLKANEERKNLSRGLSVKELHETLETSLSLKILDSFQDGDEIRRCVSMSQRTNQFNLSSRRLTESHALRLIEEGYSFVTCSLKDKFSDSGIVCFLAIYASVEAFKIFELCISCRALGRNLESLMIFESLRVWQKRFNKDYGTFSFDFNDTGRNLPTKNWLEVFQFTTSINIETLEETGDLQALREVISIEYR